MAKINEANFLFRHNKIKRYRVGEFQFNNFLLVIKGDGKESAEDKRERFLDTLAGFPRRTTQDIVELNQAAIAKLESDPLAGRRPPRTIRGAQGTGAIPAPAQHAGAGRLGDEQMQKAPELVIPPAAPDSRTIQPPAPSLQDRLDMSSGPQSQHDLEGSGAKDAREANPAPSTPAFDLSKFNK